MNSRNQRMWTLVAAVAWMLAGCDTPASGGAADAAGGGDDLGQLGDASGEDSTGSDVTMVDGSDTVSIDVPDVDDGSTMDVPGTCPAQPQMSGTCATNGLVCNYGQECCCGKCYPSTVCSCMNGQWGCYATDACMIAPGSCDDAGIDASYDQAGGACDSDAVCGAGKFCQRPTGQCGGMGTCAIKNQTCPAIYAPVCCCDGKTYGNDCEAAGAGASIASTGACAVDCQADSQCKSGEFCQFTKFACGGTGTCAATKLPCPKIYAPVCGCDGKTYDSDCAAQSLGMSVAKNGACPATCTTNPDCPGGQFCSKPAGMCAAEGSCSPFPDACDMVYDPVCGCDAKTYGNACAAALQGVNVAVKGACQP